MASKLLKRLRVGLIMLIPLYVLIEFAVLPIGFAVVATSPAGEQIGAPPDGYSALMLTTDDAETLAAWYHPPRNGAVILLIAGAGGTRASTRPYADMLTAHGFGVLAIDLRGHGESSGRANRLGWNGTHDVGAALDFLKGQVDVKAVGGLGISLGGEVLLGAASAYPTLRAIVSDGATARCLAEHDFLASGRNPLISLQLRLRDFTVQLLSGDQPPSPLSESLTTSSATQFLFVAAGNSQNEIAYNSAFAELVGERGSVWIVPDVRHTGGFARYPDDYGARVIQFFIDALLVSR